MAQKDRFEFLMPHYESLIEIYKTKKTRLLYVSIVALYQELDRLYKSAFSDMALKTEVEPPPPPPPPPDDGEN